MNSTRMPISILTIYSECLLFQFFSRGIRMHISILTGVQNGRISRPENSHILLRNVLFQAYFQHEGHLYAKFLF